MITNTLENKAKFFAQYWGQEILQVPHLIYTGNPPEPSHDEWEAAKLDEVNMRAVTISNFPLWLTPLSQIADEDAEEVSERFSPLSDYCYYNINRKDESVEIRFEDREGDFIGGCVSIYFDGDIQYSKPHDYIGWYSTQLLLCYDYLRSKGYALPFMGVSVETLVEWGWVKLKKL